MPAPLANEKRAAIEDDLRSGNLSRNAIARQHGVATSTVSRLARTLEQNGTITPPALQQAQTKNAREARLSALADRRADEAVAAFDDAQAIRAQLFEPRDTMIGKGDDAVVVSLPPAPRDVKDLAVAYGILLDKSRGLADDGNDPAERVVSLLERLAE